MRCLTILLLLIHSLALAQREKVDPISFGSVSLAEDRMPLKLDAFLIKNSGKIFLKAKLIDHSLQWVRLDQVLLVPRALLSVSFQAEAEQNFTFSYGTERVVPLFDAETGTYRTTMFISLFESIPLKLLLENEEVSTLRVIPTPQSSEASDLVDYSCAPYDVEVNGVEDDLVSVGCKIQRTGRFGEERPYLEVLFTSASFRFKDDSSPPYNVVFYESGKASVKLINHDGKEELLTIRAKVPKHLPRLRLAMGLGPYTLYTKIEGDRKNQIAPTVMLYGNLALNQSSSFRFFDSYSKNVSTFHNWGTYFAWDLARFCDQRCQLTSLIGAQGVDFRFNSNDRADSDIIYPQGFEFVYLHPFGKLNYKLSYGMFTSLGASYDYQNLWLRYGKGWFWELNFIEWELSGRSASMFGISVGFPIASFF
jgi:hypothetical protein